MYFCSKAEHFYMFTQAKKGTQFQHIFNKQSLTLWCFPHPDVSGVFPLCNSHHPQELVDVVPWITNHTAEDDQDVVNVQGPHYFVSCRFVWRHGFTHLDKQTHRCIQLKKIDTIQLKKIDSKIHLSDIQKHSFYLQCSNTLWSHGGVVE